MVRIIIAGGRDFCNYDFLSRSVFDVLSDLAARNAYSGLGKFIAGTPHKIEFISGTAAGADSLGEQLAAERRWKVHKFPADWETFGKRAGILRNEQMAKFAISDDSYGVLIAFWDGKSRGTKHMIEIAKVYGLEVCIFYY